MGMVTEAERLDDYVKTVDGWARYGDWIYLIMDDYDGSKGRITKLKMIRIGDLGHDERILKTTDRAGRSYPFFRRTIRESGYVNEKRANMEMKLGRGERR
jgi:hypothetical protein